MTRRQCNGSQLALLRGADQGRPIAVLSLQKEGGIGVADKSAVRTHPDIAPPVENVRTKGITKYQIVATLTPEMLHRGGHRPFRLGAIPARQDRKSTRLNSSHVRISYAG